MNCNRQTKNAPKLLSCHIINISNVLRTYFLNRVLLAVVTFTGVLFSSTNISKSKSKFKKTNYSKCENTALLNATQNYTNTVSQKKNIHGSLGSHSSTYETASQSVQPFLCSLRHLWTVCMWCGLNFYTRTELGTHTSVSWGPPLCTATVVFSRKVTVQSLPILQHTKHTVWKKLLPKIYKKTRYMWQWP